MLEKKQKLGLEKLLKVVSYLGNYGNRSNITVDDKGDIVDFGENINSFNPLEANITLLEGIELLIGNNKEMLAEFKKLESKIKKIESASVRWDKNRLVTLQELSSFVPYSAQTIKKYYLDMGLRYTQPSGKNGVVSFKKSWWDEFIDNTGY